jgi:hypothetical protein
MLKTYGCPIPQLYLEVGQIPIRFVIIKTLLIFLKYILNKNQDFAMGLLSTQRQTSMNMKTIIYDHPILSSSTSSSIGMLRGTGLPFIWMILKVPKPNIMRKLKTMPT